MALVIYNGVQYDDTRLPAHINPKEAVPIDEWRRASRANATRPRMAGNSRPVEPQPTETSITAMTKAELVVYAKAHSITVDPEANKPEIYAAVKTATAD